MRKAVNASSRASVKLSFELPRHEHAKLTWLACSRGVLLADLAAGMIRAGLRTAGVACSERGAEEPPASEAGG